ncbi:hypothetical protein IAE37_001271 [Pseudomonas sp. S31]|uniref:hypothetical protein n=1 Tax=Pseudomonas sp. S31 TaxID=1564473 RepID=UPI0019122997|nr:hypothetical protein [Pseudomonas sp. S31]MBK4998995.1 hypothetical protein [Pseudomonas sp. S31]
MNKVTAAYEKNSKSLLVLRDLLQLAIRQPARFAENEGLLKALRSQGAIAALEIEFEEDGELKRKDRMSTNTLKAHAANVFELGFEGFDALRVGAAEAITGFKNRRESSNKRTKDGLSKRTAELEAQLEQHQMINMVLLQGLSIAIGQFRTIRQDVKPALMEMRAKDAIETLTALVSLNPPPFNSLQPEGQPGPPSHAGQVTKEVDRKVTDLDDYRK